MKLVDFINVVPEGTHLKFLAQPLIPALIYFWKFNRDTGEPFHTVIAEEFSLLTNTFDLVPGVTAGRVIVKGGTVKLNGPSTDFMNKYPTANGFAEMLRGELELIDE